MVEQRYGQSFADNEAALSRVELMNQKNEDSQQIDEFVNQLFSQFPDGIFFNEFIKIALNSTSELFYCVYDSFY